MLASLLTSVAQYALCLIHVGSALLLILSLIITVTPRSFWSGATQPVLLHEVIPPHVQNLRLLPPELHKPCVDPVFTFLKSLELNLYHMMCQTVFQQIF